MNISTLLPDYVLDHHSDIDSLLVGVLFSSYQIVFLILAPILGDFLPRIGRRRAVFTGIILITCSTAIFACGALFSSGVAFYWVSLIARGFQGGADALILISIPSIISVEWPEENEIYQGYAGMSMGIGLMFGPVIASVLIRYLDYFWTLMTFAMLIFVLGMSALCYIPKRIDLDETKK
jgi:MFS family permease